MSEYQRDIDAVTTLRDSQGSPWDAISPEYAARMKAQNRFQTGLDILQQSHRRKQNLL